MTTEVRFDRYYNVEEMDAIVRGLAADHPGLARLETIGTSWEGREILLLVINDESTGPDTEKPAFWIDGNIHASEVAGSMAALHAAHRLLTGNGSDELVTRLLSRMAFYVLPRLNPDGAAWFFGTPQRDVRSGVRPYPYEDLDDGLYDDDVDGDGRLLTMRVQDPTGNWKVSDEDERLMVRRGPFEEGGTYYRLLGEGRVRNYDGHTIRYARPREGMDFNRNFPSGWDAEPVQNGAGPYPLSEAETRAVAHFFDTHRNINGAINYHTTGGVFFRPSSAHSDADMPEHDLAVYKMLGQHTLRITGYKAVSTWHEFSNSGRKVLRGGMLDWWYTDMGVFSFSPELWDYPGQAGVERSHDDGRLQEWYYDHPVSDDLKVMAWLDREYGGRAFVPWHEFDHPDLGRIEIGGWDGQFLLYNPPPEKLEQEISRANDFCLLMASLAPQLAIRELTVEAVGDGVHRVRLAVENTGFLPTPTTVQAIARGAVRPVRAEVEGGEVLGGTPTRILGHLQGRSNKIRIGGTSATDNRAVTEWLVRAAPGETLTVHVRSDRAGTLHRSVTIGA